MAEIAPGEPIFDVKAVGVFDEAHVVVSYDDAPQQLPPEMQTMIAEAWAKKEAECRKSGALLFNGKVVKLLGCEVREGVLHLRSGPTDYRTFVGTNMNSDPRVAEFGLDSFANPIGTTATVISKDGYLLYGRRSERVSYHQGYLHTFGGGLEQAEVRSDGTVDAFGSVLRELTEEAGLVGEEIEEMVCVGLLRDREIHQPEMIFDAKVSLSRKAILDRFDPDDPDQEHVAIEAVRDEPGALVPFLLAARPVAPVAVGAILLHGRRCWGQAWYTEALAKVSVR